MSNVRLSRDTTLEWFVTGAVDTLAGGTDFLRGCREEGVGHLLSGNYHLQPSDDCRSVEVTGIGVSHHDSHSGMACRTAGTSGPFTAGGIVHEEFYHDYTPQDIDRLYAYKESLPENKQFILENNKETLAQVFTDVRYTKKTVRQCRRIFGR